MKPRYAIADQPTASQEANLSAILQDAVERARSVTAADGAALALKDTQGIRWRASSGNAPSVGSQLNPDSGFTWKCFSTGQVMLCNDAENDPRVGQSIAKGLHISSVTAVPLRFEADGSVLGVVEVFSSRPSAFSASQVGGLVHIAQSLALRLASEMTELEPPASDRAHVPFPPSAVPLADGRASPLSLRIVGAELRTDDFPLLGRGKEADATAAPTVATEISARPLKVKTARPWLIAGAVLLLLLIAAIFALRQQPSQASSGSTFPRPPVRETPASTSQPTEGKGLAKNQSGENQAEAVALDRQSDSKAARIVEDERTNQAGGYTAASRRDKIETSHEGQGSPAREQSLPAAQLVADASIVHVIPAPKSGEVPKVEARLAPPELAIARNIAGGPDLALNATIPVNLAPIAPPKFAPQRNFKGHSSWVTAVAFSANGTELASASWDRSVKLWKLPSGEEVNTVTRKMKEVQTLAFSPDGRWLATENSSNMVTLWDAKTGREVLTLPGNKPLGLLGKSWVYSIAFSPNGRWLASGLDEDTIRIWDVETGLPVRDLSADRRSVIYVAFSADGLLLASGADDQTINIWDLTSGKVVHTLSGHTKNVYAVAFSPNGRWIASASADKTVRLWDTASGRQVRSLAGHGSSVTSVAFSPDSRWLASGSWDKTVKIWDVEKGQLVETLGGNTNPVYSVAFDSHGHWLASGSQDGTIRLWLASQQ